MLDDTHVPSFSTPTLELGRVALLVHDLDRVSRFYEEVVGLRRLHAEGGIVRLGAGGRTQIELRRDPAARRSSPLEAGLFHTAFLLPDRAALGRWLRHAAALRFPLQGASDHIVSEALYLSDPEGNGVEIYADRPPSAWLRQNGAIVMRTDPLDRGALLAAAGEAAWDGVPDATRIGHVHLQVGALAPAEQFYSGTLGLNVTCRYPGATFYAADGYHHHIATNIWNSRGAPVRHEPSTGLAEFEIRMSPAALAAIGAATGIVRDPWNTAISLLPLAPAG